MLPALPPGGFYFSADTPACEIDEHGRIESLGSVPPPVQPVPDKRPVREGMYFPRALTDEEIERVQTWFDERRTL